ncbi:Glycosyltransferase involved in cell wall bisynthesis [Micromonospora pallida]|uniref:Glycosyltransferase involved in cell wall bisynthesis n=1 Tax=Micromonospora pallida TaxID=145854 RepID=A0A1C6SEV7_9ACTN|nr:glycosyltransferase [Micromonospora pallida]SCL27908.1 Glycosyltransferase involved in cell wall bisynthesis [Micromonospora pallida]
MQVPDVSVVVPVYDTMPYLRACLASLLGQTIGRRRMEVVAVDDGSTDGGGRLLDQFAARYPDTVRVRHQANSGGPAHPCNRGLELARGRYIFFVGSDDRLGPEALERLVTAADRYDSDVVLGRAVGVNSRHMFQEIFAESRVDVDLFDSALPWSLANIKLFRRDLVERHHLRFPEDMPILSDQPFTLEACYRARRISVLADYDYYHAVRRLDAGNITYRSRLEQRLRCVELLVDRVADLIPAGKQRNAVLRRHFGLEVAHLVGDDLRRLDRPTQERVYRVVRRLVDRYLTDDLRDRLDIEARLRLAAVADGGLADLLAVIEQDAERGVPPTVVTGGRWHAGYPGVGLPAWTDVTRVHADWLARLDAVAVTWAGTRSLTVTAHSPHPDLASAVGGPLTVRAGRIVGDTLDVTASGRGSLVRVRFPVERLLAGSVATGQRHPLRVEVAGTAGRGAAALRAPGLAPSRPRIRRHGTRLYAVTTGLDGRTGQLVLAVVPVTAARLAARLRRRGR